ncbi:D-alanyl-D-alanine carboxypeptidase family protein [Defluviitalea phaphyphila]|uniref:D-alanyl-D-alanine carboxypeptidase family protein n=1 Tax=Defluviitalea phaphyphila TaxID=1473580 RepID=UPI0007305584|nr:D-alanyl-D-alanine carboxypeptidase family protein [Defluviitalea phaphyphila]
MHFSHYRGKNFSFLIVLFFYFGFVLYTPSKIFAQNTPVIQSDSAILMDAKTGTILYEKNIHKKQYPASITKIMTALLAIENGNLEDTITFSKNAVYSIEYGSSHIGMQEGEQITLKDALYGMFLMSANEVSNGIAEYIDGSIENFAEHMTKRAEELGAQNTNFVNPHGLHDENHYTTAYDMALIAKEALKYDVFREIIGTITYTIPPTNIVDEPRYLANQHKLFNNKAYPELYYEGCEGGKTGFTNEARHTLVTYAKRDDLELIVVVLKSEKQAMYDDTRNLLDYGFNNFKMVSILQQDLPIGKIPIISEENEQKKYQNIIEAYPETDFSCVLPKNSSSKDIIKKISIPEEIITPIDENQIIGTLDFIFQNKIIGSVNLIAGQSIETFNTFSKSTIENNTNTTTYGNRFFRILIMILSILVILCIVFFVLFLINTYLSKLQY